LKHESVDVGVTGAHGNPPLILATLQGQLDVVCDLLAHPTVNVNAKNKAGSTALDIARNCEMHQIANLLEARVNALSCEADEICPRESAKRKRREGEMENQNQKKHRRDARLGSNLT
jgi:ankyrin repeat protein